jgi:hypothetical protein
MTLKGSAFLALWNDFDSSRDAEYNCWHTFEHVPERVGIEGILSGRRYIAPERGQQRYFTLYELEGLAALEGREYSIVVDRPTEWSQSMRPSFSNFLRLPCTTILTLGLGLAGSIATFRVDVPRTMKDLDAGTATVLLQPFLESAGITAMHLGLADTKARFPVKNVVPSDSANDKQYVLLVEGLDRRELERIAPRIGETLHQGFAANRAIAWETFELAFVIERSELPSSTTERQPPRPDLQHRWRQQ